MKVEIKCIITNDDGTVLTEFSVVEFETTKVTGGAVTDGSEN